MEKSLIVRPGALGDTLMLLPALKDLEKKVQLTVVGREPGLYYLREMDVECRDMEGHGWHRLFQDEPDVRRGLPVPYHDRVVAFLGDRGGRIQRNLKAFFPNARVHMKDAYPGEEHETHVARYLCRVLAETGLPVQPERAMDRALKGTLFHGRNERSLRDPVVVHPGSGSPRKNLSPDLWTALLKRIRNEPSLRDRRKVLLLGPAEKSLKGYFEDRLVGGEELLCCPEKRVLRELLAEAGLHVGHDSGVTHLAAMLGAPTIAIFRESPMALWRPLGPAVKVIQHQGTDGEMLERVLETAKHLIFPFPRLSHR
jgi:ADP-heptose:LPS heptosyltransferase